MNMRDMLAPLVTTFFSWLLCTFPEVCANDNVTEESVMATVVPPTLPPPVRLIHTSSHVDSIVVNWDLDGELDVTKLVVMSQRVGEEYLRYSPALNLTAATYTIPDLVVDANYNVCLIATVKHNTTHSTELPDCLPLNTIPYIRWDSLLALIIVILILLFLVLLGCFCWRRAHRKAREQSDDSSVEEPITKKSESTQPILLAVPNNERPRSSIEDEDIPFITPPLEELPKEDRDTAIKAMRNSPRP